MTLREEAFLLAKTFKVTDARLTAVLMQMHQRNEFVKGVYSFCFDELELSEAQSYYFQKVVRAALTAPTFAKAVTSGQLSISQARRIVPVVTEANATHWIDKVLSLPQRQLEKEVREANPNASKVARKIPFSHEQVELLKTAQDVESQRAKRALSEEDVITTALSDLILKKSPLKKAERGRKMKKDFPQESTRAIPAAIKHAVVLRCQNRCTHIYENGNRCSSQRWLEIHHQTPLAQGGLTIPTNLTMLCSAHHRHQH